jgi:hypothetical protein
VRNRSNAMIRWAVGLIAASAALFAGVETTVTPEPSLIGLTAVGVGALVLIARKRRGR